MARAAKPAIPAKPATVARAPAPELFDDVVAAPPVAPPVPPVVAVVPVVTVFSEVCEGAVD